MAVVATRGFGIDADALIGPASFGLGATGAVVAVPFGNQIYSMVYNMTHSVHEDALRGPTDVTELDIRKRDKKPIICGGDH